MGIVVLIKAVLMFRAHKLSLLLAANQLLLDLRRVEARPMNEGAAGWRSWWT